MPLSTGYILNSRYRIVNLLGQGGFGAVYKAWDLNLSRPCALKENLDTSPEAQKQFNREAVILANLIHPNLARVTDYFTISGQGQYLVMDYVEGEDLQNILDKNGPQPESLVLEWVEQICDALEYLHTQQPPIIHRDIKPANIKITPKGKAVLVDFGVAKVWDPDSRTTQGARAITPCFSPFEQYGQAPTDARTDVYALGATTYCLLTGQPPTEAIIRVANPKIKAPSEINKNISSATSQTILKALELLPDLRFQTADEFKQALTQKSSVSTAPVAPPVVKIAPKQSQIPLANPVVATTRVQPGTISSAKAIPIPQSVQPKSWKKFVLIGGGAIGVIAIAIIAAVFLLGNTQKGATTPPPEIIKNTGTLPVSETSPTQVTVVQPTPEPTAASYFGETTKLGNGMTYTGTYSPDGVLYALGVGDKVLVEHAQTGDLVWEIPCQKTIVTGLAFSPDSSMLIVGEINSHFYLYDLSHKSLIKEIATGYSFYNSHVVFSPDGSMIAARTGQEIFTFDLETGDMIYKFTGHTGNIRELIWDPVFDLLYSGSMDGTVKVWNPDTGELVWDFTNITTDNSPIIGLALNHQGKTLAVLLPFGQIYLIEAQTGKQEAILYNNGLPNYAAFSNDDTILYSTMDNYVNKFVLPNSQPEVSVSAPDFASPSSLSLRPGTEQISVTYFSGGMVRFEMITQSTYAPQIDSNSWTMEGGFFNPELTVLIDDRGRIRKGPTEFFLTSWDSINLNIPVYSTSIDPERGYLALGKEDGSVDIFDLSAFTLLSQLPPKDTPAQKAAFLPNGDLAVLAGNNVSIWYLGTTNIEKYIFTTDVVMDYIDYYQEENYLILANFAGLVEIRDLDDLARIVSSYTVPVESLSQILVDQENKQLLILSESNEVQILDLLTGQKTGAISLGNTPTAAVFSQDGTFLAVGQSDGSITLLDGKTLTILETKNISPVSIPQLNFSPDNQYLLTSFNYGYWGLTQILPKPLE
jgi:serine/threonine protein kinase/sugar lactone lactonase YvrE